jgi:hypothetical protein
VTKARAAVAVAFGFCFLAALPCRAADSDPLSLDVLGFDKDQAQGNSGDQALLDKRSRMLQTHQRLGLITAVPLFATILAADGAGEGGSSGRALHGALGLTTVGLYAAAAWYAIEAPKPAGTQDRGPIRVHKALAWIHGPGMVLTPILGMMAYEQRNRGQKVHGLAAAHGGVATVTFISYLAAICSVSIKF